MRCAGCPPNGRGTQRANICSTAVRWLLQYTEPVCSTRTEHAHVVRPSFRSSLLLLLPLLFSCASYVSSRRWHDYCCEGDNVGCEGLAEPLGEVSGSCSDRSTTPPGLEKRGKTMAGCRFKDKMHVTPSFLLDGRVAGGGLARAWLLVPMDR